MSNNIPLDYTNLNLAGASYSPSTVHTSNTRLHNYFARYLMQKAISVFKWTFPKNWDDDYFLYKLYNNGFIGVFKTDKFGVIPQNCSLSGFDVFYRPTTMTFANPLLSNDNKRKIGTDSVLIKLTPDYCGIDDLVNYYADQLALCSESVGMDLVNTKLSYVFAASNKGAAESFKKMYDKIASGEPAVAVDKGLFDEATGRSTWQTFSQNLGQNYIAGSVLSDMRKIEAMFDTEIGIPNANTDKRERLITDEVNANNVETASRTSMWLELLKKGCDEVNAMFGADLDNALSVDWRVNPAVTVKQEVVADV